MFSRYAICDLPSAVRKSAARALWQLFEGQLIVGINADPSGDLHRFLGDGFGVQARVFDQDSGRGQSIVAAGADGDEIIIGLDHVSAAGNDKEIVDIGDHQKRFQTAQDAIRAPVFGQLYGRALQITVELLQFTFELFEKRERIRGGTRKTGDDPVMMKLAHLARVVFHHRLPEAYLPVTRHDDFAAMTNGQYGRTVHHVFNRFDALQLLERFERLELFELGKRNGSNRSRSSNRSSRH